MRLHQFSTVNLSERRHCVSTAEPCCQSFRGYREGLKTTFKGKTWGCLCFAFVSTGGWKWPFDWWIRGLRRGRYMHVCNVFKRYSEENIHSLVYFDSKAGVVFVCEMIIDIVRHLFIAKFNDIKPFAYSEFLEGPMQAVGLEVRKVEVRDENLNIVADVQTGSRALPTFINYTRDGIEAQMWSINGIYIGDTSEKCSMREAEKFHFLGEVFLPIF
ncbi:hypothetical protein ABKV19_027276 [Rosa sericea]